MAQADITMLQPPPFEVAVFDKQGNMTQPWQRFFVALQQIFANGQPIPIASGGTTILGSGTGTVKMANGHSVNSTAWIPSIYAGTIYYVPGWVNITP